MYILFVGNVLSLKGKIKYARNVSVLSKELWRKRALKGTFGMSAGSLIVM